MERRIVPPLQSLPTTSAPILSVVSFPNSTIVHATRRCATFRATPEPLHAVESNPSATQHSLPNDYGNDYSRARWSTPRCSPMLNYSATHPSEATTSTSFIIHKHAEEDDYLTHSHLCHWAAQCSVACRRPYNGHLPPLPRMRSRLG